MINEAYHWQRKQQVKTKTEKIVMKQLTWDNHFDTKWI